MQIYQKIEEILSAKGISKNQLLINAGLAKNVMSNMKNGSMPSVDKIAAIAEALDVSIDSLLGIEQHTEPIALRASETEWLYILSRMTDEDLLKVRDYTRYLLWLQNQAAEDSPKSQK
jgi:transcriptional regulator with XRE-family HTH domain